MTGYYTIKNNNLLIAETPFALSKFYEDIKELPFDYENGKYIIENEQLVLNENFETEKMAELKQNKLNEALKKAYEAEETGTVLYKDAVFETNSKNISKLTAMLSMIDAGIIESVQWLSKDDIQIELKKEDLLSIGQLIAEYTGALWNVQYLAFKERIENAETVQELNEIEIEY